MAIHRYILTVPRRSYEFVITITYDVIAAHHDPLDIEAVGATAYAEEKPRNLLDLMFDPVGMRPFVEEWERLQPACCKGSDVKRLDRLWIRDLPSCWNGCVSIRALQT